MSKSHEKLPKIFWGQLILAAIIGIIAIAMPSKHQDVEASEAVVKTASNNLAPIGSVATEEPKVADGGEARSGEVVYKASCAACHATGVANAPKLDDKAAWEPRVATGLDALLNTAINGKGAMPAKGGNPAITDEEIKNTVLYMTSSAGFDLAGDAKPEAKKEEAKAEIKEELKVAEIAVAVKKEEPVAEKKAEDVKTEVAKAASVPVAPATPKAPEAPKMKVAAESMAMAVAAPIAAAAPVMKEKVAEVKAKAEKVVKEVTAPVTEKVVAVTTADPVASPKSIAAGKVIYQKTCFSCHAAGIAGSPKLDDKANWAPRIDAGLDSLYASALNGKGVMPPKGGNMGMSDEDVKSAVDYMVSTAQ